MASSELAENVMSARASGARWLALSIILGSLIWTGGIVRLIGGYLGEPERAVIRYCEGRCICDGGSMDAGLMQRVCPEGWQSVFARSVRKLRKSRRRVIRERARRLRESQQERSPSSLVPSV